MSYNWVENMGEENTKNSVQQIRFRFNKEIILSSTRKKSPIKMLRSFFPMIYSLLILI